MSAERILIIDPMLEGETGWAEIKMRASCPEAEIDVICIEPGSPIGNFKELRSKLREHALGKLDMIVLPFRVRFLKAIHYWINLLALLAAGVSTPKVIKVDGAQRRHLERLPIAGFACA